MTDCAEVIFVSDTSGVLQCIDPTVGTTFVAYKGLSASKPNTVAVIGKQFLLALDAAKPLAQVWHLNSQEPLAGPKIVLAGKGSAAAAASDGLCLVIAIDTKLYIFQTTSGQLLGVLSKHYRAITKVVFMDDSCHFVSCGENGAVLVWSLAKAVMRQGLSVDSTDSREPVYSFSHHSLRVTDAYIGPGSMKARLFTCSIDQTCKLYNLRDGSMLLSIVFESSLTALCPNIIESELFVGTNKGELLEVRLDPLPRTLEYSAQPTVLERKFTHHTSSVTSLKISLDGHLMVSAGDDSKVVVWDIPSRQVIRVITLKSPAASLILSTAYAYIFSDSLPSTSVFNTLQRVSSEDSALCVNVVVNEDLRPIDLDPEEEKVEKVVVQRDEDKQEVERLSELLKDAVAKNKQLYQYAMEKLVGNPYAFAGK